MKLPDSLQPYDRRIFLYLVAYRWASLVPAAWLVFIHAAGRSEAGGFVALALAAANALLISIFHQPLNRWLLRQPVLLGIDLLFCAGLLAYSGSSNSPYYLYALSPMLAGAFFFQARGALAAAGFFSVAYMGLRVSVTPAELDATPYTLTHLFSQLAGIWLIPLVFAYPSILLRQLNKTGEELAQTRDDLRRQNDELARANRQLGIIHELTMLLQAAPDIHTVQERVLVAVTHELGHHRAAVALVDPVSEELGDWRMSDENPSAVYLPTELPRLPLVEESGPLVSELLKHTTSFRIHPKATQDEAINAWLGDGAWRCFPLSLRDHPVGVLLIGLDHQAGEETGDSDLELTEDQQSMLEVVASQASVALGTTMVCIDRTRNLAVEQERNRIARDIHDTVAQSLFGIVFTLDACISMLPQQAEQVLRELAELRELASQVRDQVRNSIYDLWPAELNLERFKTDLISYVAQSCRLQPFHVNFSTSGNFNGLPSPVRRALFRVAQEALVNSARYSGVNSAQVCLDVEPEQVYLRIRDEGRGFDLDKGLEQTQKHAHYGLSGMLQRIHTLGGECEILTAPEQGTLIVASIPSVPAGRMEQLPGEFAARERGE